MRSYVRLAAADVGDPLPEHGGIDERVAPEDVADAEVRADERPDRLVRDEPDLRRDEGAEVVVHDGEVDALQAGPDHRRLGQSCDDTLGGSEVVNTSGFRTISFRPRFTSRCAGILDTAWKLCSHPQLLVA
jgi:hypothetical protein